MACTEPLVICMSGVEVTGTMPAMQGMGVGEALEEYMKEVRQWGSERLGKMKGKIESVMKRGGAMDGVTHKAVVNMQAAGEVAETTRQSQKPEMRSKTRDKERELLKERAGSSGVTANGLDSNSRHTKMMS